MQSPGLLWEAYNVASDFSCRPSALYDVRNPVEAFAFDRSVYIFGSALKAELESVNEKTAAASKNKRQRILQKWIPEASVGYKDPANREL